jgi:hypothetical protein
MTVTGPKSLPSIGFLTVCERPGHGLFGGYLLLNTAGRPLQFHCTAPVRPNRAQEILYGPTLKPFLYGEHIGRTLLSKAGVEPLLVCTDVEPALTVRPYVSSPVVLVMAPPSREGDAGAEPGRQPPQMDPPSDLASGRLLLFSVGPHRLAVSRQHGDDREQVVSRLRPLADDLDLAEPFGRIREAIDEARQRAA